MRTLGYNFLQALRQIRRNKGMSFASVFAITAMLLILGIFFVISINVNLFTEMVKADYDQIEIFLKDNNSKVDIKNLEDKIDKMKGVEGTTYRSKEEALTIMRERWGESGYLLDSLGKNPLPSSILINIKSVDDAKSVISQVDKLKGIEDVRFYQETIEKLTKVTNFIQWAAVVVMVFLIIISIVVVSNTVKLTVFARAKEISIMKYVGATNWFIRGPFLIEGIIIGIFSSLIAAGITYFAYLKLLDFIGIKFISIFSSPLVSANYMVGNLVIIFLAIGVSVGACGSVISMRRFLDA